VFVLGIDPGLSRCGYCCLEVRGRTTRAVAIGVLRTPPELGVPERLARLQLGVRQLLVDHAPSAVAVERVLFQVNVRTAMSVGQASGIVMAEAVHHGASVTEYSPNQVKEAVTGWGSAPKAQVQDMVQALLALERRPEPADAADAAAVALCHVAMAPLAGAAAGRPAPRGGGIVRNRVRRVAPAATARRSSP
jgi:crossover junction endodeoxyribonuclease RuvC